MASDKGYLLFILDQLPREGIDFRPMMGEYILYYHSRVFGGIYDDRFLVKPTPAVAALLADAPREIPYETGKPMLLVENVDDKDALAALMRAVAADVTAF